MFRLLFLFALLLTSLVAWPTISSTDKGTRDPLTRTHDAAVADAERIGPLVQKRFALYAAMQRCGQADNQYIFNFTKERFGPSERFLLEKAAYAGWEEGGARAATDSSPCAAAIDRLRAADDALLAQAELLPDR